MEYAAVSLLIFIRPSDDSTREPSDGIGRRPASAEAAQDVTSHAEQFFATNVHSPLPTELVQ